MTNLLSKWSDLSDAMMATKWSLPCRDASDDSSTEFRALAQAERSGTPAEIDEARKVLKDKVDTLRKLDRRLAESKATNLRVTYEKLTASGIRYENTHTG